MDRYYTAKDIDIVTEGSVPLKTLNNWTSRQEWFVPPLPAEKGRPRTFTRLHVIEAALAAELMSLGVSREAATMLLQHRCSQLQHSGWVADLPSKMGSLPELSIGSAGWAWVFERHPQHDAPIGPVCAVRTADGFAELAAKLTHSAIIVPISKLVSRVDTLE